MRASVCVCPRAREAGEKGYAIYPVNVDNIFLLKERACRIRVGVIVLHLTFYDMCWQDNDRAFIVPANS